VPADVLLFCSDCSFSYSIFPMTETEVRLNVHELGVILSALQLLENRDEHQIAREYGSSQALYHKLSTIMEGMDTSETGLRNDVVPSF
jgi:hypothetical protein